MVINMPQKTEKRLEIVKLLVAGLAVDEFDAIGGVPESVYLGTVKLIEEIYGREAADSFSSMVDACEELFFIPESCFVYASQLLGFPVGNKP